jgi:hypothetical protein
LVALLLVLPVAAQAFSKCDVSQLGGPGAQIAEEGSNPVISGLWAYTAFTLGSKVMVQVASANGASPTAVQTIFDQPGKSKNVRLAAVGGNVYVVWLYKTATDARLMFAASAKNGVAGSWRAPIDLGSAITALPQISADGDNVHIAFVLPDQTTAVVSSSNNGRKFAPAVALAASAGEVVISSRGSDVYTVWETLDPVRSVEFAYSHDNGVTFKLRNLSADTGHIAREPILSLNQASGRLSLVWREADPQQGVYFQSTDGGKTFNSRLVIDVPARQFMVQDDGDFIYVSYLKLFVVDGRDDYQVLLAVSTDGGMTFPSKTNLSGPTGISAIEQDNLRPVPWAADGEIRLTGVTENGVYIWSGNQGVVRNSVYLGPGLLASPQKQVAAWMSPDGVATYAFCHGN